MIPTFRLNNGCQIPRIGLGTFGSDNYSAVQVAEAVQFAASNGFRHFDCAAVYGNEKEVGKALKYIIRGGLERENLWVTSKVWNNRHQDAYQACLESLADLGLDYLDLYLIHWPFPNHHDPGCSVHSRNRTATPFILDNYLKTWRQLEDLVNDGLVKSIGTSNMTMAKMRSFLPHVKIRPVVEELELHPHFQQSEYVSYLKSEQIQPVGYCPLGSPGRPERDRMDSDTSPLLDPFIHELAIKNHVTPAQICLKWEIQTGIIPIPFSVKQEQIIQIKEAINFPDFNEREMVELSKLDRNCRLIKGQVFLWKNDQDWTDLWDLDGSIAE